MIVINRRNAIFGFVVWEALKGLGKQKAKAALPSVDTETKRPNKSAIALFAAGVFGALLFFKSRSEDEPA